MKTKKFKSVDDLIAKTTSKTFQAYRGEMRRHERALQKIFAGDEHHKHVPEEVGSVNRVWPDRRRIVTFYRCELCLKDLTEKEVKALTK